MSWNSIKIYLYNIFDFKSWKTSTRHLFTLPTLQLKVVFTEKKKKKGGRGGGKRFFFSSSPHTLSLTGSNSNPKEKIKTTPPFLTLQKKKKKKKFYQHTPHEEEKDGKSSYKLLRVCVYSSFICMYIYVYVYKVLSSYIFEDKTFFLSLSPACVFWPLPSAFFPG